VLNHQQLININTLIFNPSFPHWFSDARVLNWASWFWSWKFPKISLNIWA